MHNTLLTPQQRYYAKNKDKPEYKQANRERSRRARERKKAAKALGSTKQNKRSRVRVAASTTSQSGNDAGAEENFEDLWAPSPFPPPSPLPLPSPLPPSSPFPPSSPLSPPSPLPPSSHSTKTHRSTAFERMLAVQEFLADWRSEWGPIRCWPTFIYQEYQQSLKNNEEKEWRARMVSQAEQGRLALDDLRSLFKTLPKDHWKVQNIWFQALDAAEEIL